MLKLNTWTGDNGFTLIFINGLSTPGKASFRRGRNGIQVNPPPGATAAEIEQIVAATFRLSLPLTWDQLISVADTDFRSIRGKKTDTRTTVVGTQAAGEFTDDDAFAIDEDMRAYPIPTPTTILADHREPDELIRRLRGFSNLFVEQRQLDVADITYPGIIQFERKTAHDFGVSIIEDAKRLFHQVEALTHQPGRSILIIEGDLYRKSGLSQPNIDGALSYITTQGVMPIRTMSLPHTAYMIAKLTRHYVHGLGYDLGLRGSAKRNDPIARKAIFFAEGLPGVSNTLAKALLARFGTIQALANATEKDLRDVDGIGPRKAAEIAALFTHKAAPAAD